MYSHCLLRAMRVLFGGISRQHDFCLNVFRHRRKSQAFRICKIHDQKAYIRDQELKKSLFSMKPIENEMHNEYNETEKQVKSPDGSFAVK